MTFYYITLWKCGKLDSEKSMLVLAQLLLVLGFLTFVAMPVAFLVFAYRRIVHGGPTRGLPVVGAFLLGALASGAVAWTLVPSEWTLPLWTTLQATVDAQTYGHQVEHCAEGIVLLMTFAALCGGTACAGAAAFAPRLLRKSRLS